MDLKTKIESYFLQLSPEYREQIEERAAIIADGDTAKHEAALKKLKMQIFLTGVEK